jgi:hypothetical protein
VVCLNRRRYARAHSEARGRAPLCHDGRNRSWQTWPSPPTGAATRLPPITGAKSVDKCPPWAIF